MTVPKARRSLRLPLHALLVLGAWLCGGSRPALAQSGPPPTFSSDRPGFANTTAVAAQEHLTAESAGDLDRARAASDELFAHPLLLLPASRARAAAARVRLLRTIGDNEQADRLAQEMTAWFARYASGLSHADRRALLALPSVRALEPQPA